MRKREQERARARENASARDFDSIDAMSLGKMKQGYSSVSAAAECVCVGGAHSLRGPAASGGGSSKVPAPSDA